MQIWQYLLLAAIGAAVLALAVISKLNEARRRKHRDFTRRLETLLLPKEEIKTICPGKPGHWILTNKRLILEDGDAFLAFPFKKIKKVSGADDAGKATTSPKKMAVLTVKTAEKEFSLHRKEDSFPELVKGLKTGVSRAKPKKKKQ